MIKVVGSIDLWFIAIHFINIGTHKTAIYCVRYKKYSLRWTFAISQGGRIKNNFYNLKYTIKEVCNKCNEKRVRIILCRACGH